MESKLKQKCGFTLIELLVVISIISFLACASLVVLNSSRMKSRDAKRISDFKQIQTALEMFFDQTGFYPQSSGHPTWSGHWAYFSQCLETGVNCGFSISNYSPVIAKVPQDPLRKTSDPFANDFTYYPASPTGCGDGRNYRIAALLETEHQALDSDLDGSFYNNNGLCDENTGNGDWYCVGSGTCAGW